MRWLVGGQVYDVEHAGRSGAPTSASTAIASPTSASHPAVALGDDDVVELDGAWLLPGLIDCHVHLTQPTDAGDPAKASARSDAAVALVHGRRRRAAP